jgi:hypothetical protein
MNLVLKLSEYFYRFEEKYFQEISNNKINDKIAWYILKIPLFYYIYHKTISSDLSAENIKERPLDTKGKTLLRIGRFFIFFWRKWLRVIRKSRTNKTIIIPLTVDKRRKGGKYQNVLFDKLILNGVIKDPLVMGISKEGELLEPSDVSTDIYLDHLSHLTTIISRISKKKYKHNTGLSLVYQLILRFLKENNIDLKIDYDWVITNYAYHMTEYKIYKNLFKKLQPKTIVVTDQSFSGKIRAANDLNITVIEYQHGLMDKYYPHYTIPEELKPFKKNLILEDQIVVFGEFHRQQILKHHFWDKEDIVVTGNAQINEERERITGKNKNPDDNLKVLFPTQGLYNFDNAKLVLEQLKSMNGKKIEIIIRPHPLEPEKCLEYYRRMQSTSAIYKLVEERVGIFNLIAGCDVVLGFDSTALLEAIAIGTPAITIASSDFPKGIHSMLKDCVLEEVIKIMVLEENKLPDFLNYLSENYLYLENWRQQCIKKSNFLYEENYLANSRALFNNLNVREELTKDKIII